MEDRMEWEMLVLSACIQEKTAFMMVGSYLKVQNFMTEDHRAIWQRMNELYPYKPINLLSFKDIVDLQNVTNILKWHCPVANVLYYAGLIIEMDIRRHLIDLLDKIYNDNYLKNPLTYGAIDTFKEIKATVANHWIDLFETLDSIREYFKSDKLYHPASEVFEVFYVNVEKRMGDIKKQAKIQNLFHELSSLDHLPTTNRLVLQKLGQFAQYALNGIALPKELETFILSSKI